MNPGPYGPNGDYQALGDFLVAQVVVVEEHKGRPLLKWNLQKRAPQALSFAEAQRFIFGRILRGLIPRDTQGHGVTLTFPSPMVLEQVGGDPKEPRCQVSSGIVRVAGSERPYERLLHEILSQVTIAGHPVQEGIQTGLMFSYERGEIQSVHLRAFHSL